MPTRVIDGARRERRRDGTGEESAALVSRVSRLRRCRARALLSLKLKKKRDCSQSTVWANGEQNSGKVNFVADSSLPFVQISFIYRKTAAKAWNWYQRWLWSKWKTNFRLEHSVLKNRTAFSEVPLLLENFYWNDPNGLVPFILQPDFPEIFCKW